jgi:non-homologous end joining protein Ku
MSENSTQLVKLGPGQHIEPTTAAAQMVEFIRRTADGESMRAICSDDHMPSTTTICNWLSKADDIVLEQYARAMDMRGQRFGERVTDIAERVLEDKDLDPNRAKVATDALKWAAARLSPKKYGDRIEANVSGAVEVTLVPIMPGK